MAHELKHLVAMGYRILNGLPWEEAWAEEPSAEVAKELAGYGTVYRRIQSRANVALPAPQNFRIVHVGYPSDDREMAAMYGFNFLLLWRIHENYGREGFWRPWVQSRLTGIANLEARTGVSFTDLMVDWALTLLVDNTSFFPEYQYADLNLRDGTWKRLGYQALTSVSNQSLRSMAFYIGKGTGSDATVTLTVDDPSRIRVAVARFPRGLPY